MKLKWSILGMFGIVACSSISVQDPDSPVSDLYLEKRAPMRFGKRFADPEGLELIRYVRAPMRFGKRSFWSGDAFTKKSPMRFGKRSVLSFEPEGRIPFLEEEYQPTYFQTQKRAPMRFGKRDSSELREEDDYDVEKRAPMRFG